MAYQFAVAYETDDGFAVESSAGADVNQLFVRGAETWRIVRVYSLGYVIVNDSDPTLWPTVNADYDLAGP